AGRVHPGRPPRWYVCAHLDSIPANRTHILSELAAKSMRPPVPAVRRPCITCHGSLLRTQKHQKNQGAGPDTRSAPPQKPVNVTLCWIYSLESHIHRIRCGGGEVTGAGELGGHSRRERGESTISAVATGS